MLDLPAIAENIVFDNENRGSGNGDNGENNNGNDNQNNVKVYLNSIYLSKNST